MTKEFDIVVIGGGPAGYVAAIRAAQLGMTVACVDDSPFLGGTCLNVGCIPSKTLLQSSDYFSIMSKKGASHGIDATDITANLSRMMQRKTETLEGLGKGIEGLFNKNKITRFQGHGTLTDTHTVSVGEETITGKNIILAMGSSPLPLPFLDFDEVMVVSSTGALSLTKIPKHLVVIGAGVIGVELASVYARLGSKVTIVEYLDAVCPMFEPEISKQLKKSLTNQGIAFRLSTKLTNAKKLKTSVQLDLENKRGEQEVLKADTVLVAIGRHPRSDSAGILEMGVSFDLKGFVKVNEVFQTSVPHIYAVGDLIDGPMLAHKASEEGAAVAEHIAGHPVKLNYITIPSVVYTNPEVASVGLGEQECKDAGINIVVTAFPFKANSRARCSGEDEGLIKLVAEATSKQILGMHIIGAHASELIAYGAIVLQKKATAYDIALTSHAHPTCAEVIKEAALALCNGKPIHM